MKFSFWAFVVNRGPLLVLANRWKKKSTPPGGCLSQLVKIVTRDFTVLGQLMVSGAAGQKVVIIQPTLVAFFQWLDVMDMQNLLKTRDTEDSIAAFIADPAHVEIALPDVDALLLPGICFTKRGSFAVASMLSSFGFLWANIFAVVDLSAVLARSEHQNLQIEKRDQAFPTGLVSAFLRWYSGRPNTLGDSGERW